MYNSLDTKKYLSLAAILFFAPFVHYFIYTSGKTIDEDDNTFIRSYIMIGYGILTMTIILFITSIMHQLYNYAFLGYIYTYTIIPFIIGIICCIVAVIHNKRIFDSRHIEIEKTQGDIVNILISFIPIYNFYIRYKNKQYNQANRWQKEGLIRQYLCIFVFLYAPNDFIKILYIFLYVSRIASLIGGFDVLGQKRRQTMNTLFSIHVEEVFGYFTGAIQRLLYFFQGRKVDIYTIVEEKKRRYSTNISGRKNPLFLVQHGIIRLWIINIIYNEIMTNGYGYWNTFTRFAYIAIMIIICKFISAYINKEYSVLPVLDEMYTGCLYLIDHITKNINQHR